jgi:hypothetical protein
MTSLRHRILVVDASYDADAGGIAGLGVGFLDGGGIAAEAALVGPDGGVLVAEALALTRGLSELADMYATAPGSIVITDNMHVYKAVVGIDAGLPALGGPAALDHARHLMAEFGFTVEWRPRKFVRPAHRMARIALEIFRAGLSHEATWESPPPIVDLKLGDGVPAYPPDYPPIAMPDLKIVKGA